MRRIISVFLVALMLLATSLYASAEEQEGGMMGKGMMQGGMMGKKDMMMKSGKMAGMSAMHKMMQKEMVATKDGGIIVMTGNKLLKYDKDLNLIKEVEIKMDVEGTCKMMKMMEKCAVGCCMMIKEDAEESAEIEESGASTEQ